MEFIVLNIFIVSMWFVNNDYMKFYCIYKVNSIMYNINFNLRFGLFTELSFFIYFLFMFLKLGYVYV